MITLLLGPLACLAVLPTIYLAWLCRDSPKSDQEEDQEEEWLLERFIGFLRQLDNGIIIIIIIIIITVYSLLMTYRYL